MAPALLLSLGSALIDVFTPLAKEKIQKEIGRHTDNPEVAAQVATAAVETAKALTGKADPIDAVAEVKKDPALVQQVETSALDELTKLGPLLERLHAMDRQDRADNEASMNAAAARAREEADDMAPKLVDRAFVVYMTVFVSTLLMIGLQMFFAQDHKPAGELVGFFIAVATLGARQWEKLFDYRFGSSRGSSAKDAVIAQVSQRGRGA